jgi:hypothetical protein
MTPAYAYLNALPTKQDCSEAGSARHIVHQEVDAVKNPPKFSKPNPASQDFLEAEFLVILCMT